MENRKEEILKELEYLNNILRNANPNSDAYDFEYYQKYELEKELEELEKK